jgi:hypothetical protein
MVLYGFHYLYNENIAIKARLSNIEKLTEDLGNSDIETKKVASEEQDVLNDKIDCLELIKKTPERGPQSYIGINIINYYKFVSEHYQKVQNGEFSREDAVEDNEAELKFYTELYNESKPMYDNYINKCGN